MRIVVAAWVAVFLSLFPLSSQAQTQSPSPAGEPATGNDKTNPGVSFEGNIVVTANRVESEADTVGSSVTVISREEIEQSQKTEVLELLRTVPGIEVSETSAFGKTSSVFIRGANSNQTLVLIDGVRANNTAAGGFDFADLLADNVERIEVLRGPQSTLYGSDAIGGVVSITTRRGEPGFHGEVQAEGGNYQLVSSRLLVHGASGPFDYSASASGLRAEGVSAASTNLGNTEPDPYRNTTLSGRFGLGFLTDGRVDLTVRSIKGKTDLDGFSSGHPVDDPNYTQDRDLLQTSLQLTKPLTSWWKQTVRLGTDDDRIQGHDPDTFFNNYDIRSRLRALGLQSDLRLSSNGTLVLGYEGETREAVNRGSFSKDLSVRSFFVQDLWSWERLNLTGGVRNDNYSNFGGKTTYRFTGSFLLPTDTRLHGSIGTGFRAPDFDELFFPGAGNQSLRPESSRGSDLGIEQSWLQGKLSADLTYFRNRFDNLIVFDLTSFQFNNVANAKSEGLEATLKVRPASWLELSTAYTYDRTENLATGAALPRRPLHRGTLQGVLRPTDRLSGSLSLLAVRDRVDSSGRPMDNYQRVDLTTEYRFNSLLRSYLRIENLLDSKYEEIPGYTTPRFRAALGLRAGIF